MNNNKITNPKVEMPKGMNLNDKDHIEGVLSDLKALEKNYATALTEASNEVLYNLYKSMFDEIASLQREVYELMFRYGWYPMEAVEQNKISEKVNMFTQEKQDLTSN